MGSCISSLFDGSSGIDNEGCKEPASTAGPGEDVFLPDGIVAPRGDWERRQHFCSDRPEDSYYYFDRKTNTMLLLYSTFNNIIDGKTYKGEAWKLQRSDEPRCLIEKTTGTSWTQLLEGNNRRNWDLPHGWKVVTTSPLLYKDESISVKFPRSWVRLTRAAADVNYKATIAIDLGTKYSGYSFKIRGSETVHVGSRWGYNAATASQHKTPTSVLLSDTGEFLAFGCQAFDRYYEGEDNNSLFFSDFKMILHNQEETKDPMVTAANGKEHRALYVFAAAIGYLKDHALDIIKASEDLPLNPETEILWVLTIPAIWTVSAREFMLRAAKEAGLAQDMDRIVLVLEPEAAALHCRTLPVSKGTPDEVLRVQEIEAESSYVVIDAGGGTLDMVALKATGRGGVKELVTAGGGAFGGRDVDTKFEDLLEDIFGKDFIQGFKRKHRILFQRILEDFEAKKCQYSPATEDFRLYVSLPYKFHQVYEKKHNQTIEQAVQKFKECKPICGVTMKDELILEKSAIEGLFQSVQDKIVEAVDQFISQEAVKNVSIFFLVGGFALSLKPVLLDVIKKDHESAKIIVPLDASTAVLKGAVTLGNDPSVVRERIVRETYEISVESAFPEAEAVQKQSYFVRAGDVVKDGMYHKDHTDERQEVRINLYACKIALGNSEEATDTPDRRGVKIDAVLAKATHDSSKQEKLKLGITLVLGQATPYIIVQDTNTGVVFSSKDHV